MEHFKTDLGKPGIFKTLDLEKTGTRLEPRRPIF